MKFRKRPIEVEAMQVDGTTKQDDEIRKWSDGKLAGHWSSKKFARDNGGHLIVAGRGHPAAFQKGVIEYYVGDDDQRVVAEYGDWIIRGTNDEFSTCKPDIFEQTYEPVDDTQDSP